MNTYAPPRKAPKLRPIGIYRKLLIPAALLLVILSAGLVAFGLPVWQSALWGVGFAAALLLRLDLTERTALLVSRCAFALVPLVGYSMVEVLNYNAPWKSFPPIQVVLNLVWYYLIACALYLILGRRVLSAGTAGVLFFLIGMANRYIIRFRGRTIFPGDLLSLQTAVNVAGNYDYRLDAVQLGCLLALGLLCLILWKLPRQKGRSRPRLRVLVPVLGAAGLYLLLFFQTGFLSWLEIEPSMWTTRGNGFLLNFSVCLRYSRVDAPDGYSEEALSAIPLELPEETPQTTAVKPENIIVVMNESFADLSQVADLPVNQDYLPFWRSLTENTIQGTAYSSVFGGTTANSEYEFLTGNTMAFLPEGTVPYQLYVTDESPSLVGQLKALGYDTLAMHPYLSSGWNRVPVYRDFGFRRVLFQGDFEKPAYMRDYITDQSNYENVIKQYEAKDKGQPLFIFNVTMQNHSAYNVPWKNLDRSVWLTGALEGRYKTVDQYLSLIYESDRAFEYLIDYFSKVEEPTMVLMFGDHQPQVATNFYTDVLGGEVEDLDSATAAKKYKVPFLLWANYDIPEEDGVELSLNYLSSLLMETAGLPLTGYQQFLNELRQTVPAVNALGYMDSSGVWYRHRKELPDDVRALVNEYAILQYNQLFDSGQLLPDFFTLPGEGGGNET